MVRLIHWHVLAFLGLASGVIQADIKIDNYAPAVNDRFTNSGSFVMSGFDLSGVGQYTHNGFWGTLISPNVIITAFHAQPSVGSTIRFYPGNDPSATPIDRTITSTRMRIGSTDLSVAVLNQAVKNAAYYPIADEFLTGPPGGDPSNIVAAGSFQGINSYMFGRSPQVSPVFRDQAVGRNRISGYWENVDFNGTDNDALILDYNTAGDLDYVFNEAHFRGGDSGGPFFIESNGELLLLGTNAFILIDDNNNVVASGVNYVGNQAATIRNFIQANAVPEPSGMVLGFGLLWTLSLRVRRRVD